MTKISSTTAGDHSKISSRRQINSTVHHPRQNAKTLMRLSVKKPSPKPNFKVNAALSARRTAVPTKSLSLSQGTNISHRSPLIKHFSSIPDLSHPRPEISIRPKPTHVFKDKQPVSSNQTLEHILSRALENATSHEEPPFKTPVKIHRRLFNALAANPFRKMVES